MRRRGVCFRIIPVPSKTIPSKTPWCFFDDPESGKRFTAKALLLERFVSGNG